MASPNTHSNSEEKIFNHMIMLLLFCNFHQFWVSQLSSLSQGRVCLHNNPLLLAVGDYFFSGQVWVKLNLVHCMSTMHVSTGVM